MIKPKHWINKIVLKSESRHCRGKIELSRSINKKKSLNFLNWERLSDQARLHKPNFSNIMKMHLICRVYTKRAVSGITVKHFYE